MLKNLPEVTKCLSDREMFKWASYPSSLARDQNFDLLSMHYLINWMIYLFIYLFSSCLLSAS